jgi:hypothetical protein
MESLKVAAMHFGKLEFEAFNRLWMSDKLKWRSELLEGSYSSIILIDGLGKNLLFFG